MLFMHGNREYIAALFRYCFSVDAADPVDHASSRRQAGRGGGRYELSLDQAAARFRLDLFKNSVPLMNLSYKHRAPTELPPSALKRYGSRNGLPSDHVVANG